MDATAFTPQALKACRPVFILDYLDKAGLAKHELTADMSQVPEPIRKILPKKWGGFGLSGGYGVGKTFCLSACLRKLAEHVIDEQIKTILAEEDPYRLRQAIESRSLTHTPWPLWCNWPGEVAARRAQLYRNQGGEVEDWIQELQNPNRLVILDDIGADRATGQDWAGEVLARIIDERLRQQAPIVWTSNLNSKELTERYGARTYSRLHALAPIIRLPSLPDLRLNARGCA